MIFDLKKYLGKPALIDDSEVFVTFDELQSFREDLEKLIPARSIVFVLSRNTSGSMASYVALIDINIVPAMFGADTPRDMMDELIDSYHPGYIWLPDDMVEGYGQYQSVYSRFGYTLLKTELTPFPIHKDVALLLTTSGSTGSPKLVRLSYENVEGFELIIKGYNPDYEENHHISTMPIYHNYDLLGLSRMLIYGWYCCITTKSIISPDFWKFFRKYKANSFGSVPFNYQILERIKFRKMEDLGVIYTTEAGGSLSLDLTKKYDDWHKEHGSDFNIIYGATEAPGGVMVLWGDDIGTHLGSIGKPVPPGTAWLEDDDGNVIDQPNVSGEIVYRGPIVCMGYATSGADLIKEDEYKGLLHTGDIAYRDEDGFYYIVGRKARFLKLLGERVSMDETEQRILTQFPDMEVACFGVDNDMKVYITKDDPELDKALTLYLVGTLNISPTLFKIYHTDALPRLANGKTNYTALSEQSK